MILLHEIGIILYVGIWYSSYKSCWGNQLQRVNIPASKRQRGSLTPSGRWSIWATCELAITPNWSFLVKSIINLLHDTMWVFLDTRFNVLGELSVAKRLFLQRWNQLESEPEHFFRNTRTSPGCMQGFFDSLQLLFFQWRFRSKPSWPRLLNQRQYVCII